MYVLRIVCGCDEIGHQGHLKINKGMLKQEDLRWRHWDQAALGPGNGISNNKMKVNLGLR